VYTSSLYNTGHQKLRITCVEMLLGKQTDVASSISDSEGSSYKSLKCFLIIASWRRR
jgi:hypothetical protein